MSEIAPASSIQLTSSYLILDLGPYSCKTLTINLRLNESRRDNLILTVYLDVSVSSLIKEKFLRVQNLSIPYPQVFASQFVVDENSAVYKLRDGRFGLLRGHVD